MAGMLDYVRKCGGSSFDELPFNEIDNLIFATIGYMYFEDLLDESFDNYKTIEDLASVLEEKADIVEMLKETVFMKETILLFHIMAGCRRYKDIRIEGYVAEIDFDAEKQFAAMTFICEGFLYVCFRGTDNILISWKEDFNIGYMNPIPAQVDALHYLEDVAGRFKGKIYVGGHSKGGNLAVYAALNCSEAVRSRIATVFNNDGPGFATDCIWKENGDFVKRHVRTFVPQTSIVGVLMETGGPTFVVKSNGIGILQHNPFTWQTIEDGFVLLAKRSKVSYDFEEAFLAWFRNLNSEEKKTFIDTLYNVLISTGATTINQLTLPTLVESLRNYNDFDDEKKEEFINILAPLLEPIFDLRKFQ